MLQTVDDPRGNPLHLMLYATCETVLWINNFSSHKKSIQRGSVAKTQLLIY